MTFHAACGRLLRRDAARAGYSPSFTIYDQADQLRLVKACIEELELDPKRFAPRAVHTRISRAKERLLTAEAYTQEVSTFFEQAAANVYALYERRLHDANAMDFDDLIMRAVLLLEHNEEARKAWQERWRYVMVDEYQDTNHAQFRLVSLLAERHRNIAVVGDQDQSIYAFRGADIRNIAEFEHDFPGGLRRHARAELPLDAVDPRRREPRHRPKPEPQAEAALVGARERPSRCAWSKPTMSMPRPGSSPVRSPRRSTPARAPPTSPSSTG